MSLTPQVTTGSESSNAALNTQLGEVSASVDSLSSEVSALSSDVADLDSEITLINASIVGISANGEILTSAVSTLEGRADALESDVASLQGSVSTLESDLSTTDSTVSTLSSGLSSAESRLDQLEGVTGLNLSTNTLIQTALSSSSVVEPSRITYQSSDLNDLITLTGIKTLKFTDCGNVGFSFRWADNDISPPQLIFQGCSLSSSYSYFDSLLDIENATGEIILKCLSCVDSNGQLIPDFTFSVIGGL